MKHWTNTGRPFCLLFWCPTSSVLLEREKSHFLIKYNENTSVSIWFNNKDASAQHCSGISTTPASCANQLTSSKLSSKVDQSTFPCCSENVNPSFSVLSFNKYWLDVPLLINVYIIRALSAVYLFSGAISTVPRLSGALSPVLQCIGAHFNFFADNWCDIYWSGVGDAVILNSSLLLQWYSG